VKAELYRGPRRVVRRLVHDSGDDAAIDLARLIANEIDDVILWRVEDIAAQV